MPVIAILSSMNSQTTKKVTAALGVAAMASATGSVAVKAGPALQSLTNMTNTAEFTINNTYGQSFSVDGAITAGISPFQINTGVFVGNFTAGSALVTTNFTGGNSKGGFIPVAQVGADIQSMTSLSVYSGSLVLNATALGTIVLNGDSGTVTVGASISSTLFGPSTVKASSSFTNQLINDLSAF